MAMSYECNALCVCLVRCDLMWCFVVKWKLSVVGPSWQLQSSRVRVMMYHKRETWLVYC